MNLNKLKLTFEDIKYLKMAISKRNKTPTRERLKEMLDNVLYSPADNNEQEKEDGKTYS